MRRMHMRDKIISKQNMNEERADGLKEDPATPASSHNNNNNDSSGGGSKSKSKSKGKSRSNNVRTQEVQMSYNKPINIPDMNVLLADPPSSQSTSNHSDASPGKIRRGSLDKNKRPIIEHSASDPQFSRDRCNTASSPPYFPCVCSKGRSFYSYSSHGIVS